MAELDLERPKLGREEYERLVERGTLRPEDRSELLAGRIVPMTPQSSWHAATVHLVAEALAPSLRGQPPRHLRIQAPLALDSWSEPEPDLAVVSGSPRDYLERHPASAPLVVEIAHRSLRHDRERKLPLYAAVGLQEVWIVSFALSDLLPTAA